MVLTLLQQNRTWLQLKRACRLPTLLGKKQLVSAYTIVTGVQQSTLIGRLPQSRLNDCLVSPMILELFRLHSSLLFSARGWQTVTAPSFHPLALASETSAASFLALVLSWFRRQKVGA